jgi:hypothetical protein
MLKMQKITTANNMDIALTISIISFLISGLTFWLTRVRRGALKMTRPSIICFTGQNGGDEPKIFIRTLLFATSDLGQYIQSIFIRVHRAETIQNFNTWAYGNKALVMGSGLYISKTGFSEYHHFLLPKNEHWDFLDGEYRLEVFVETVNNKTKKLFELILVVTKEQAETMTKDKRASIFFHWAPNSQKYISHTTTKPYTTEERISLIM